MLEYSLDVITYYWLQSINGPFIFVFLVDRCGKESKFAKDIGSWVATAK
jgi:hypothetical protein